VLNVEGMTFTRAFDVVDVGQGRWTIQLHESRTAIGSIARTSTGLELFDWLDRPLGTFSSTGDALRFFLGRGIRSTQHLGAA
jgi:hypothetical protein